MQLVLLFHRLPGATFSFGLHCLFAVSKERSIICKMSLSGSFVLLFPYETNSKITLQINVWVLFFNLAIFLSRHTFQINDKSSRFVFIFTCLCTSVRTADFVITADLL